MIARSACLVAAVAVLVAGCGGGHDSSSTASGSRPVTVRQLANIGELQSQFNAHRGVPRLVVLLSPT